MQLAKRVERQALLEHLVQLLQPAVEVLEDVVPMPVTNLVFHLRLKGLFKASSKQLSSLMARKRSNTGSRVESIRFGSASDWNTDMLNDIVHFCKDIMVFY